MLATITPQELAQLRLSVQHVELIDVRTPVEFQGLHADFARNVPLDQLDPAAIRADLSSESIYVICGSGSRSRQACEKLAAAGLKVVNVEGGTAAWNAAGLPMVRGRNTITLERQVRIAAGSLVLIFSILALTVYFMFAAQPAFIGAGLIFAGITDTCGMGMILARMPWNQVAPASGKATHDCASVSLRANTER